MKRLSKACEALVEQGLAKTVSGGAIRFTGNIDQAKLAKIEKSYANAFHKRWLNRTAKEREAEKRFHDFIVTY